MINFTNLPDWDQNNFSESQNLTVYDQWPSWIGLVNNIDRVNPPVADFDSPVPSGWGVTQVPFNDDSTGSQFQWLWDFGDGSDIDISVSWKSLLFTARFV